MTVADTKVPQSEAASNSSQSFLATSIVGGLIVLAGIWLVLGGLPYSWGQAGILARNPFLSGAMMLVVGVGVLVVLGYIGNKLLQGLTTPGIRAGVFVAAVLLFFAAWITVAVGNFLAERNAENVSFGLGVTSLVLAALLAGIFFLYSRAFWRPLMVQLEDQGWFHYGSYKGNQGGKVRRATLVGILTIGVCGIVTMLNNRAFGSERDGTTDWKWILPYMGDEETNRVLPLLYNGPVIMPLVLGLALIWFAYRVVNLPAFADFLIATEAEMNKVSWTTRKRLFWDTIVVLVTVFLMTAFLFTVDLLWIQILSNPYVSVLRVDLRQEQQKQQEKATW